MRKYFVQYCINNNIFDTNNFCDIVYAKNIDDAKRIVNQPNITYVREYEEGDEANIYSFSPETFTVVYQYENEEYVEILHMDKKSLTKYILTNYAGATIVSISMGRNIINGKDYIDHKKANFKLHNSEVDEKKAQGRIIGAIILLTLLLLMVICPFLVIYGRDDLYFDIYAKVSFPIYLLLYFGMLGYIFEWHKKIKAKFCKEMFTPRREMSKLEKKGIIAYFLSAYSVIAILFVIGWIFEFIPGLIGNAKYFAMVAMFIFPGIILIAGFVLFCYFKKSYKYINYIFFVAQLVVSIMAPCFAYCNNQYNFRYLLLLIYALIFEVLFILTILYSNNVFKLIKNKKVNPKKVKQENNNIEKIESIPVVPSLSIICICSIVVFAFSLLGFALSYSTFTLVSVAFGWSVYFCIVIWIKNKKFLSKTKKRFNLSVILTILFFLVMWGIVYGLNFTLIS